MSELYTPYVKHLGDGRSRAIEPLGEMPRVLIAIPACHKFDYGRWESGDSPHFNAAIAYNGQPYGTGIHISGDNDRIQAVRDTWAKDILPFSSHVDFRFFYGEPHPRPAADDEVYLTVADDYAALPLKTIAICKWAVEQDYDYLFKADDDSYVWVSRLIHELMSHKFDYAGYLHHNVCTGGAGYWLSRRAMKEVVRFAKPCHWAEDVTVAHAMNVSNIVPQMLPKHLPGGTEHWFDIADIPEGAVCIHAVAPDSMRELYRREHQEQ